MNQEFLIANDAWDTLLSLHGLTRDDYTETQIEEIKQRQQKREQNRQHGLEKHKVEKEKLKKQSREKIEKCKELYMLGVKKLDPNDDAYVSEEDLDDLLINTNDTINKYTNDMIDEDIEFLNS